MSGAGTGGPSTTVFALATFDDGHGAALYAGGEFWTAGGNVSTFFARWSSGCRSGDVNCDGGVSFFDIDPFVLALFDPDGYAAAYPSCDISNADLNADSAVNFFDIDPFVACLFGACP